MTDWTREEIKTLREKAAEGWTAGMIAKHLRRRTRNAVIGKCFRDGIQLEPLPEIVSRNRSVGALSRR